MPAPAHPTKAAPPAPPAESIEWVLAGRALVEGSLRPVELGIDEHGTIAAIGRHLRARARHDVGEAVILPAAIDLHTHFRDPGPSADVESFPAGTIEAAIGGVGLVADMPNTSPPVTTLERLLEKEARVEGRAAVDVLLYAAPSNGPDLERVAARAGGFKLYLSPTTGVPGLERRDDLPALLERIAATGLPLSVHAEDPVEFGAVDAAEDLVGWNRARPPAAEEAAVRAVVRGPAALRLHVAHVTSAGIARDLAGRGISFEATPHHLLLSERSEGGSRLKVNPPLRSEATRAELFRTFEEGVVPCLASDHAPHAAFEKDRRFPEAPSGMPNVETMLPLLLEKVREGALALERLVAVSAQGPAAFLGLPRGRLAVGRRADLLVVDFRERTVLEPRELHAPCGWTAFEGWTAIFPREHYRAGVRIVETGEYVGRPNGEVVRSGPSRGGALYGDPPRPARPAAGSRSSERARSGGSGGAANPR